ncbi:HAD family hydrolase [Actinophytocola oryzae]|uniref:HAD superfamily hydrolase (TIGR01493 family)/HAD superfamily hydrolase (TIGR01509 family)/HAD superfamily hydrolase (TIGR01549 family) n=1 Tax=Actinophytocola oryzae TaxID=502181 RepID=A0A4R7VFG5_9PSEU|nr:HAD-IA family hydrolase [Actinophytocola oryzae]TDV47779.1 HAD superfamily hydrolase (TIGR01493 family)/HAD superfamily hydrolase (TIGR01509 family)/HAD superfamily hydrolase (TIGR01549 family) [Actinophytocola oryzae]
MIDGVLFDFSGTLFRFEPGPGWPSGAADEATRERLVAVLTAPVMATDHLPPDLRHAWTRRDLDPGLHRTVYLGVLGTTGVDLTEEESEGVYTSLTDPRAWNPYPDTEDVLRGLRAAGVPVAVVSNIAWDIRGIFARHGVEDLVDEFVLSYVEGVVKPDPRIFRIACRRLGIAPERALMVGDSPEADGGAASAGAAVTIVEPLPTARRPDALRHSVSALLRSV